MHVRHVPSGFFFTIIELETHLEKKIALRIHASTNLDTYVVIASRLSFSMARFFYHTGNIYGWMLSLCFSISRDMPIIYVGVHENMSLLDHRSL